MDIDVQKLWDDIPHFLNRYISFFNIAEYAVENGLKISLREKWELQNMENFLINKKELPELIDIVFCDGEFYISKFEYDEFGVKISKVVRPEDLKENPELIFLYIQMSKYIFPKKCNRENGIRTYRYSPGILGKNNLIYRDDKTILETYRDLLKIYGTLIENFGHNFFMLSPETNKGCLIFDGITYEPSFEPEKSIDERGWKKIESSIKEEVKKLKIECDILKHCGARGGPFIQAIKIKIDDSDPFSYDGFA